MPLPGPLPVSAESRWSGFSPGNRHEAVGGPLMRPEGGAEDSGLRPCRVSAHLEGGVMCACWVKSPRRKCAFVSKRKHLGGDRVRDYFLWAPEQC